jgi:hypothetical protein
MNLRRRWSIFLREGQLLDPIGTSNVALAERDSSPWPGAWLLVVAAGVFNLWSLRAEARVVAYPNDSGMHLQMTELARHLLAGGMSPFDHWYPLLSLGSPFFVQYQSFSALLVGALGLLAPVASVYALSLYLLLALWPVCVYWSARLFNLEPWAAAVSAAMAPLLFSVTSRGFGHQSYVWIGSGLWSQLFAMWTLPLAWALSWRWIARKEHLLGAALALALTVAFHFLTAYLALLSVGVWLIIVPTAWRTRLVRTLTLVAASMLLALPVTVPILLRSTWQAVNQFQVGTTINNSYGAPRVLAWLFTGQLFDFHRWAVLSFFLAVAVVVSVRRWRVDERVRALVGVLALSLVLFCGRPSFAWLIDLIPGNQNLLLQRFIMGVQLAGILLAGLGLVSLGRFLAATLTRWRPRYVQYVVGAFSGGWRWLASVAMVASVLLLLLPGLVEINHYDGTSRALIVTQEAADSTQGAQVRSLVAQAERLGGGRIYAGMPSNWGRRFSVGDVPVYLYLEQLKVDAVGFTLRTSGLMTDPEAYFDQRQLADYELFGVKYIIMPTWKRPAISPVWRIDVAGHYALWELSNQTPTALLQVIDTSGSVSATNATLGPVTRNFLASSEALHGVVPTVAFAGAAPGPSTLPSSGRIGPPGRIERQVADLVNSQSAEAVVATTRRSALLFKVAFDPHWVATIDGQPAKIFMVAPALMAVAVPAGTHDVVFTYRGFAYYPELLVVSGLTLAGLVIFTLRRRRRPVLDQGTDGVGGQLGDA